MGFLSDYREQFSKDTEQSNRNLQDMARSAQGGRATQDEEVDGGSETPQFSELAASGCILQIVGLLILAATLLVIIL